MTEQARRVLFLLTTGHQLVRGPTGWRCVCGAAFERVSPETAAELLRSPWVIAHGLDGIVLDITEAGRAELERAG